MKLFGIACSVSAGDVLQATVLLQAPAQCQPTNGVLLPAEDLKYSHHTMSL